MNPPAAAATFAAVAGLVGPASVLVARFVGIETGPDQCLGDREPGQCRIRGIREFAQNAAALRVGDLARIERGDRAAAGGEEGIRIAVIAEGKAREALFATESHDDITGWGTLNQDAAARNPTGVDIDEPAPWFSFAAVILRPRCSARCHCGPLNVLSFD